MAIYKPAELDLLFHALGDATRRDMLGMLAKQGSMTAGQLAEPFPIAQPTISKHLKVLEQSALIERRIEGRTHFFSLCPAALEEAEGWLARHRKFWTGSLGRLGQLSEALPAGKPDK